MGLARSFSAHVRLGERGAPVPLSVVYLAVEGARCWVQQYRPLLRFHLCALCWCARKVPFQFKVMEVLHVSHPASHLCCYSRFKPYGCLRPNSRQLPPAHPSLLEDAFHTGLLLRDTNGDSIADAVCAHIVVPDTPDEGENTAAANLAARLGYETSGITLPIVTTAAGSATFHAQCSPEATSLWVGRGAVPAAHASELEAMLAQLQLGEGGVFSLGRWAGVCRCRFAWLAYRDECLCGARSVPMVAARAQAAGTCGSDQWQSWRRPS